jgi:hypothetical protein
MRSLNNNPLSKLRQDIVVPLLENIFVSGVSNIVWEYYCSSENNVLYYDCTYKPNIKYNNTNNKWLASWENPLRTLSFNANQYYKFVVAGGFPLQLLTQIMGARIDLQTDIDVFLVCTDNKASIEQKQKAREDAINYFIQHIYKNIPTPPNVNAKNNVLKVIIQQHVLTFYNYRMRPIQLILSEYESIDEIFKYFDITISKCAYDGKQFIVDDDAIHDLQCVPPQMSILRKSPSMPYRTLKYMCRGFGLNIGDHTLDNHNYLKLLGIEKFIRNITLSIPSNMFLCNAQDNIDKALEDKSSYDHVKSQYDILSSNIRMFVNGDTTKYIETIDINDPFINNYQLLFHKNLPELKYQISGDGTLNPVINKYYEKFQQMYNACNIHNMHKIFPEKIRIKYLHLLMQNISREKIDEIILADFKHFISVQLTDLQYIPPTFEQPQRVDNIFYEQI